MRYSELFEYKVEKIDISKFNNMNDLENYVNQDKTWRQRLNSNSCENE